MRTSIAKYLAAASLAIVLQGCVAYAPPPPIAAYPGYGYPAYGYSPGFYPPAVGIGVGPVFGFRGWGWGHGRR